MEEKTIDFIQEDNKINFGHNNLIYSFSQSFNIIKFNEPEYPNDLYTRKQQPMFLSFGYDKENKRVELSDDYLTEEPGLFKLSRISLESIKKPNETIGPTLSISLFMPNKTLFNDSEKISKWCNKYLAKQLQLIFMFNYFFPNGNIRIYLDHYLIEKFKKIVGNDVSLHFDKIMTVNNFSYASYDGFKDIEINNLLSVIKNNLIEKDAVNKFQNGAARIIYYMDYISRCYPNSDYSNIELRDKSIDIFVYKFGGIFIENLNSDTEGHITDGYIGQHMRYIALRQKEYIYNNMTIKPPKHIIWRDAHAAMIGALDSEWIAEVNKLSMRYDTPLYFLGGSLSYFRNWHGYAPCNVGDNYLKKGPTAGIVQIFNSTIKDDDLLYVSTIGLPFLICTDGLILEKLREKTLNGNELKYSYGIDEYALSSFFYTRDIIKYSLYFDLRFLTEVFAFSHMSYDIWNQWTVIIILLKFLESKNIVKQIEYSPYDLIVLLEKMRNKEIDIPYTPEEKIIAGYLLSLISNKYSLQVCLFNIRDLENYKPVYLDAKFTTQHMINELKHFNKIIPDNPTLTTEYLEKTGLDCRSNILNNTVGEWCQLAYKDVKNSTIPTGCPSTDYFSGFYDDKPPSLDIGILRCPDDLPYAYEAILKNKLLRPLNKSNYKIKREDYAFENVIANSFSDVSKTNIKPNLLNLIFPEESVLMSWIFWTSFDAKKDLDDRQLSALVWKSLNFYGYDVPPELFNSIKIDKISTEEFNTRVKKLAEYKINNISWADNTFNILTNNIYAESDKSRFMMELMDESRKSMQQRRSLMKHEEKSFEMVEDPLYNEHDPPKEEILDIDEKRIHIPEELHIQSPEEEPLKSPVEEELLLGGNAKNDDKNSTLLFALPMVAAFSILNIFIAVLVCTVLYVIFILREKYITQLIHIEPCKYMADIKKDILG